VYHRCRREEEAEPGGVGGGYGSGLSARLTDRPKRRLFNLWAALYPVMGVMRRKTQGGGGQPGVVGREGAKNRQEPRAF
jgi:hypothetical protein